MLLLAPINSSGKSMPSATIDRFENQSGVRFLQVHLPIPVPLPLLWEVLTDYNESARFLPGIKSSQLLSPLPSGDKRLKKETIQGVLFFTKHLHTILRISEKPPNRIEFSLIEGDFHTYYGAWTIDTQQTPPHLVLTLHVQPSFFAPTPITDRVVRTSGVETTEAMVKEAMRRNEQKKAPAFSPEP